MNAQPAVIAIVFIFALVVLACALQGFGWLVNGGAARFFRSMSSRAPVPGIVQSTQEQRSDAVEQVLEQSGTLPVEHVPELVEVLEALDDATLLDILSRVRDSTGEYRFAESRIGRFVGGRLEDRIAEVRTVREVVTPARTPVRTIQIRSKEGTKAVAFEA